ncbi:MAG: ABC transporter permease subunit [Bacteroidota bacterium]|nr:ABC transporter permease subunit [Bacteroidota bacterium]
MKLLGGTEEGSGLTKLIFGIGGVVVVLLIWYLVSTGGSPDSPSILPSPWQVFTSFGSLVNDNELFYHVGRSVAINISGYIEAILMVIPLGFIIGLIKFTRWGFQRQVDALRYIPLTAVTVLFTFWFGIGVSMKVHFLAFGILIYLLPIMVQRIDEVDDVYLKTVHTLGATDWQVLRSVYFPSVLSRLFDDIRVLTAISWTYIIVAEGIYSNQGGIGTLIYYAGQRQARYDKVFALLIIIMIIGVLQDKIFQWLDRQFFPHKYQARDSVRSSSIEKQSLVKVILDYVFVALGWIGIIIYLVLMINEYTGFLGDFKPLTYLFGETTWVIHLIVIAIVAFRAWKYMQHRSDMMALQSVKTQA